MLQCIFFWILAILGLGFFTYNILMTTLAYPAHECKMGTWTYYVAQLSMNDIKSLVSLHQDLFEQSDRKLSVWLQRPHEKRDALLKYLSHREDRFFSSIVVDLLFAISISNLS